MRYNIQPIDMQTMREFVVKNHYSSVMPRITKKIYGGFVGDELRAAVSFGYGSRPVHTVKKMFPEWSVQDYLEVGKMCLLDSEPRNSESHFLSRAIKLLRRETGVKMVFSWSDGMWGKPGYIYQASNFLYGEFIWSDSYVTSKGQRLHPLQINSFLRSMGIEPKGRTQRPFLTTLKRIGWKHVRGKMFRYARFFEEPPCSPFTWSLDYPKTNDCEWQIRTETGWISSDNPQFLGTWDSLSEAA